MKTLTTTLRSFCYYRVVLILMLCAPLYPRDTIVIGCKNFPESRVLGELMAIMIESHTPYPVERRWGLGGTLICFEALQSGDIDIYPEYTGTGLTAILNAQLSSQDPDTVYAFVREVFAARFRIEWLPTFGFNNTYAIVAAPALSVESLSELGQISGDLRAGFSLEFLNRPDGYPGLVETYGFQFRDVRGMEHGLAYQAVAAGKIDVTDAYSTDGKLEAYQLKALRDDRRFFPPYYAAPLVRQAAFDHFPELRMVLEKLHNRIGEQAIRRLNYRVEVQKESFREAARSYLIAEGLIPDNPVSVGRQGIVSLIAEKTLEHLFLTLLATGMAVLVGIPLGLFLPRSPRLAAGVLGFSNIIQTVPSLAILGLMIPLFGIGMLPAVIALFLYALLPILRNTYSGINAVDARLIEAGTAMGMSPLQRLMVLELPMATGFIMAGVRTATVINIGTATLAAFIGAGGLGELIITGITLNDKARIIQGAVPAALLALVVDFLLARLEKRLVPKGLQIAKDQERFDNKVKGKR